MNKHLFLTAILIIFMQALLSSVVAQEHGPPPGGPDRNLRDSSSDLKGRSNEIERVRRDNEKRDAKKSDLPPAPNFSEIKEDFERIQIINNDVLQANASSETPDYGRISESAAEINKRAIRLKSNLFTAESRKKTKETERVAEDQKLTLLLTLLDNSITSFTQSSIFQNTKLVSPADSSAAEKELESIIKISTRIRNEADRMKKGNSLPK